MKSSHASLYPRDRIGFGVSLTIAAAGVFARIAEINALVVTVIVSFCWFLLSSWMADRLIGWPITLRVKPGRRVEPLSPIARTVYYGSLVLWAVAVSLLAYRLE